MTELLQDRALTQPRIIESAPKRRRRRATMPPAYLRPSDVADRLSISLSTVYMLVREGVLPSIRIRGAIRICAAGYEKFVASQEGRQ